MRTTVVTQSATHDHAWRHQAFWKMLAADLILIGFTATVFPARTGVRLALMLAAILIASLVLNVILVPAPLPGSNRPDSKALPLAPTPRTGSTAGAVGCDSHATTLFRRSLQAHEAERAAVAEEIRATVAQQLTAITLHLTAAAQLMEGHAAADSVQAARNLSAAAALEIGALAEQIAPAWRGEFGLIPALGALQQRIADRGLIECDLRVRGDLIPMRLELTRAILRVADVAVENVERHAGARSVTLDVSFDRPIVRLEVADDAKGFDLALLESGRVGLGLFRAKELLAHEGGKMQIESAPGQGTRVLATVDLSREVTA